MDVVKKSHKFQNCRFFSIDISLFPGVAQRHSKKVKTMLNTSSSATFLYETKPFGFGFYFYFSRSRGRKDR